MYEYLQIGEIVNTHGVKGELKVMPLTDNPERYDDLEWIYLDNCGNMVKYNIGSVKYIKGFIILKLCGVDSVEAAEALKGRFILVDRKNAVKLPEGSFFICDLIGSDVYETNGGRLGKLVDVLHTGSNDVFVVRKENNREILLPALKSVVREILPDKGTIKVEIPEGLSDYEV